MTRGHFRILFFIASVAIGVVNTARAEPASVCLYDSKSYSDGAFICAQKSLMLTCSSDGAHATWKIVADKDLSDRCVAPMAHGAPSLPGLRRHARWGHGSHHIARAASEASAKCFSFNGRQYCE